MENNENMGYTARLMRKASTVSSLVLLIFTVFMFGGSYLSTAVVSLFLDKESEYYNCLCMLLSMLIQSFGGVFFARLVNKCTSVGKDAEPVRALFRKPQQSFWWVVRWIFIAIFFCYATSMATNLIFTWIQNLTGVELLQTNFSADDNALSKAINILCITIMAPFFEEVLIRGIMLGNSKRYGTWSAAIATGLFFGLLHMNYPQVPFAAVMGIISAFLVLKTKSIIPSVIVHLSVNTIGGIMSLFTGQMDVQAIQGGDISSLLEEPMLLIVMMCASLLVMGLMGIGLIFFIIEIVKFRDSFKLEKVYPEVSEGKKLLHYFSSPLTIILALFYLGMTIYNAIPEK